jgi:F-type H+-transporting ATPase subunit delta
MPARFTKPYVDALFEVAGGTEAVERLLPGLDSFARTQRSSAELRAVLRDPGVDREKKIALVSAIAAKAGVSALGTRLLGTLLGNRRIGALDEVLSAVRARIDRERNVVEASVLAAIKLDASAADSIRKALEAKTKKSVRLAHDVDPTLLGGFVVKIGSEVYDASLRSRLARARRSFHTASEEA